MVAIPVWTSTRNTEDKESEDAFIESNSELTRISNEALNSLDPAKLSLKKSFGAHVQVQLPKEWIEKLVPKALDWAQSSLDLSLRHVQIALTGTMLSISSASRDRIITLKTDVEMTESGQEGDLRDFSVCVSAEQLGSVMKFLQKAFGTGNCDIGVKINDSGACDYLLICCYGIAPSEDKDVMPMKRDATGNPIVEPSQSLKAALFKIQRSIGTLPMPTAYPNWDVKYQVALNPTLRWVFSNKQDYVEFISDNGTLKAKFKDEADRTVSASLGSNIACNIGLPEDDTPIAYIKGAYFRDIFNYVREPVSLTFGFEKTGDKYTPTPIFVESDEICAIIAQVYPDEALGKIEAYITHKKGKVVDADKAEAEKRARKQNKGAESFIEFDTPTDDAESDPTVGGRVDSAVVAVSPMGTKGSRSEHSGHVDITAASTSEDEEPDPEGATPEISLDAQTTEELLQSIADSRALTAAQNPVVNDMPDHVHAAIKNVMGGLSMLLKQQKNMMRDTMTMLQQMGRLFGTEDEKREIKRELDAQKDPETKQFVYDIDAIANYFMERAGKDLHITAVRDSLPHLKMSTVNTTILKLVDEAVIERVKKGIYKAPDDVAARYELFRVKYPARRKKL